MHVTVVDPDGREHDETGIYPMAGGQADVTVRIAANDSPGRWELRLREQTSGLTASAQFNVE